MNEQQSVRVARVWLEEDGIARVMHHPDVDLTLADAEETMAAYRKIYEGKKRPLLVDTRRMRSVSRETRQFYASEQAAQAASAVALLVDTPVSRVLGNFYLGLSSPHLPTRLFTTEAEALTWLKGYLA